MKAIKLLGLAALSALMAMALLGASSAMAENTALCTVDPGTGADETCPSGRLYSHGHGETPPGEKARLLTSILTIECTVLSLGDVLSANLLGSPLIVSGTSTYTDCGSCEVKELNGPAEIEVLKLGHELADITGKGEVLVKCGKLLHCVYNGTGLLGHGLGPLLSGAEFPNGVTIVSEKETNKVSGTLCPSTAKLDGTATSAQPVYVTL